MKKSWGCDERKYAPVLYGFFFLVLIQKSSNQTRNLRLSHPPCHIMSLRTNALV